MITQGIGVITGLQESFSWVSVAAAGIGGGIGASVGKQIGLNALSGPNADLSAANIGRSLTTGAVSALANAATRSALDGSNFGDNITAAIPDVIGQTLGTALGGSMVSKSSGPFAVVGKVLRSPVDLVKGALDFAFSGFETQSLAYQAGSIKDAEAKRDALFAREDARFQGMIDDKMDEVVVTATINRAATDLLAINAMLFASGRDHTVYELPGGGYASAPIAAGMARGAAMLPVTHNLKWRQNIL